MGFRLQAVPSVPVPDVAAVITVDEQALGGGPGLAHRVHLPEGSMMTEFVAAMEGLSLGPATTVNASNRPNLHRHLQHCQSQATCQNPTCPATMGRRQAN